MSSGLTEYEVREALAKREPPIGVSHEQLVRWQKWGLLERDEVGRWAPSTDEQVARIHALGKTILYTARRVIVLQANSFRLTPPELEPASSPESTEVLFRVPPEALRRAMVEVAGQIHPHLKKMKRIAAAVAAIPGQADAAARARGQLDWRPPYREEWMLILESASLEEFAQRAGLQYYLAALIRTFGRGTAVDVSDIPFEEQVVLLTIRDLAARARLRRAKSPAPRGGDHA